MSNNVAASVPKYWSRRMQLKHEKTDVFRAIANFEEEGTLKNGDTVHRPYRSTLVGQDYTKGAAFTTQDITDADEYLVVDQTKIVPFYVDSVDSLQSNYKTMNLYADDAAIVLSNLIDGAVLGEYDQATSSVDDADLGGTSGNGITVTTANLLKLFSNAARKLDAQNIGQDERFAVISPQVAQVLMEYLAGKESQLGDSTGQNGNIGKFYGFTLYKSNSCGWSGELLVGTLPTDGDTVVINGVTFAFETGTIDAAGKVKAVTDADTSAANLVAAINAPGTTSATFQALSAADQAKLKGITATADAVNHKITLKVTGKSYIAVSETLTAAADIWTAAKQIQHNLFGRKGAVDVVIQKYPNVEFKDVPDKLGKNVAPWTLYGKKTFSEGAKALVDVKVRSDQF